MKQKYTDWNREDIKKRNLLFFFILGRFQADFSFSYALSRKKYYRKRDFETRHKKIHGVITITATTPLLNLNLNYEKLQHKDK